MNPWSFQRKFFFALAILGIIIIVGIAGAFFFINTEPTCFDGQKNGDETGTDCGGSCQFLCSFEAVEPTVLWSRSFQVAAGVYSAVAYVENQNINSEGVAVYTFKLYDDKNILIASRENTIFIPRNKIVAIFEPNIDTQLKMPTRVDFEFTKPITWRRNSTVAPELVVTQKVLSGETDLPRVDAVVENKSTEDVEQIEIVSIVYDNRGNAVGSSRTFIDRLVAGSSQHVTFTWPQPFLTTKEVCRVPVPGSTISRPEALGVILAIDRSGSMVAGGSNPPQPLTDVKNAVISFIKKMSGTDQIGIVSFSSAASDPVDSMLSRDYQSTIKTVEGITVATTTTQYTNIADGLDKSISQFLGPVGSFLTRKVIILLTDGIANRPEKAGVQNYAETSALEKATAAKQVGVEIFTISLGKETNTQFLLEVATSPDHYFSATTSKDLASIYDDIAVRFCTTGPSVVEVIPRIIPKK